MLKGPLIHPPLLEALARAGHGSKVLIADANYPHATKLGPNARLIHLNVSPGLLTATYLLALLKTAIPIEHAAVMRPLREGQYAMEGDPAIYTEFRHLLADAECGPNLEQVDYLDFYDRASASDVAVTIATGEGRLYANLLLTVGVVMPKE